MAIDREKMDELHRNAQQGTRHTPLTDGIPPLGIPDGPTGREALLARLSMMAARLSSASEPADDPRAWKPPTPERIRRLLRESGLRPAERELGLDAIEPPVGRYRHQAMAHNICREYLAEAAAKCQVHMLPDWWIVLESRSKGTGKSYIALSLVADLCRLGIPAVHLCEADMLALLWASQGDGAEFGAVQLHERWLRPSVLVIDDWLAKRPSEFVAYRQYELLAARERSGRPTILTTNVTRAGLASVYAADPNQGERILSRVEGMCLPDADSGDWPVPLGAWITMDGPDLRKYRK